MSHVPPEELHPLFYALERHHSGEARIPKLKLDDELQLILSRLARDDSHIPEAPERLLSEERVKKLLDHASTCNECEMLVYEKGPYAERPKTAEELEAEGNLQEEEERKLTWRFWLHTVIGFLSFCGASVAIAEARKVGLRPIAEGPGLQSANPGFQLNPYHILFMVLLLVAAFCLAEAWRVANLIWLDWTRFKEAVPVVGKRWAAKGKKKKKSQG